jgi:phage shock protein A
LCKEKPFPVSSEIFKSHISSFLDDPERYEKIIEQRVDKALSHLDKLENDYTTKFSN